ncbi:hypothetical protein GA0070617_5289 [Micromonospora yangpuensis]|uniref:Uncharacterized protein n=2 Tax=Micromonosporaceae TaxID=28056 RepID=A0A1C6VBP4_9ACTN|nr:hypothetical protein GA0070617_5289 [Micromonospora yangpuensis]
MSYPNSGSDFDIHIDWRDRSLRHDYTIEAIRDALPADVRNDFDRVHPWSLVEQSDAQAAERRAALADFDRRQVPYEQLDAFMAARQELVNLQTQADKHANDSRHEYRENLINYVSSRGVTLTFREPSRLPQEAGAGFAPYATLESPSQGRRDRPRREGGSGQASRPPIEPPPQRRGQFR